MFNNFFNAAAPSGSTLQPQDSPDAPLVIKKICCVGAGYVGGPTAAVIAYNNPDIQVTIVDLDQTRIRRWNSRHPPIYEPGLHDIIRVARDGSRAFSYDNDPVSNNTSEGSYSVINTPSLSSPKTDVPERLPNLFFSTDVGRHIGEADLVMIAVNTPTKYRGIGAGSATDMTTFEAATGSVAQYARPGALICEKSTVPCRTAQLVRETLAMHRPGVHFEILSNPEFLAAGTAVKDLLYPDRILIGSDQTPTGLRAAKALVDVYAAWIPRSRIITTNVWSSELAKLVANSMLAQRISSINSISAVCEKTGADVDEISKAIGCDPRIGDKFLCAGIGFGGSCFKKDILNLVYLADSCGLEEVGEYWRQVVKMNDYARDRFTNRIIRCLNNTLVGKKITLLGYAFKKNTSDTREAPALEMIKSLLEERPREIAVFDPCCNPYVVKEEIVAMLGDVAKTGNVKVYGNGYDACRGSTAVVIATEFDEFSNKPLPASSNSSTPNLSNTSEAKFSPATKDQIIAAAPPTKPKIGRDPRPFGDSALPSPLEVLTLHKYLMQQVETDASAPPSIHNTDDPLDRFHVEPSCIEECPDCRQEREAKVTGDATGMGSGADYKTKERLDWAKIASEMSKPRWLFDGRGVIDRAAIMKHGIRFESVGRQGGL